MNKFSCCWSSELKKAIEHHCPVTGYEMNLNHREACIVQRVVNQGIDSYLEACYIQERGDRYTVQGDRLVCSVSPASLTVLVRRLFETGEEEAESLASAICETLGLELI